jgi:N-formylglutamate deformylase
MEIVSVSRGASPVILAFPHAGTILPDDVLAALNENGRRLADTDWHIDRLYRRLLPGATMVVARVHRYVIDVNRDPSGESLYPGRNTTGLIPETDFDGAPIWISGHPPANPVADRLARYHAPYHSALGDEIARVKAHHGIVLLYDCHSIRSRIPFLFEGVLPDFNIGTNGGVTCDPLFERATMEIARAAEGYRSILNGRFKGGWTTRHYGRPGEGVHAIQMELAQSAYLASESPPFAYDETKAARLRIHLGAILARLESIALDLSRQGAPI